MQLTHFALGLFLAAQFDSAYSHPGMKRITEELLKRQTNNVDGDPVAALIGDLATTGPTSPVGSSVANILQGVESGETSEAGYNAPGPLGSSACAADTCCVWSYVAKDLNQLFSGITGRCNKYARAAIRLGFHDAGTWSQAAASNGQDFGGADGSIALSGDEINRSENNGLQDQINKMLSYQKKYNVGMADLIQFAAKLAVVTCPLGPRIRTFVGRVDSSKSALNNLMPSVTDSADKLVTLFGDKGISPHDLAALLGAHTASQQFFVNQNFAGLPQDITPGVWDVTFYNNSLAAKAAQGIFRLQSDVTLAQDPRLASEWQAFAGTGGQSHWNEDYATAYIHLSLLGVNNINNLTECSKVLPATKSKYLLPQIPLLLS